ncbi:MAG TPA: BrxA/BrxB family bacilliredoxin [Bacillota bacterium]|nr:BrxA/BrxB family bacilliredoxin [Bacillota bacterium]
MMSFDAYMNQMKQMVQPMREELTNAGFKELTTPEEVEQFFAETKGTALMVVNSVCGCAAGVARPAVVHSLNIDPKPDQLVTVFAGQDKEATAEARKHIEGYPPSSPSVALFKDGKLVYFMERQQIEVCDGVAMMNQLRQAYDIHCK